MRKTETQLYAIFKKLRQGHLVSPMDALDLCGCFRLSARIAELKDLGVIIENRSHGGKFAEYKLVGFQKGVTPADVQARLTGAKISKKQEGRKA